MMIALDPIPAQDNTLKPVVEHLQVRRDPTPYSSPEMPGYAIPNFTIEYQIRVKASLYNLPGWLRRSFPWSSGRVLAGEGLPWKALRRYFRCEHHKGYRAMNKYSVTRSGLTKMSLRWPHTAQGLDPPPPPCTTQLKSFHRSKYRAYCLTFIV